MGEKAEKVEEKKVESEQAKNVDFTKLSKEKLYKLIPENLDPDLSIRLFRAANAIAGDSSYLDFSSVEVAKIFFEENIKTELIGEPIIEPVMAELEEEKESEWKDGWVNDLWKWRMMKNGSKGFGISLEDLEKKLTSAGFDLSKIDYKNGGDLSLAVDTARYKPFNDRFKTKEAAKVYLQSLWGEEAKENEEEEPEPEVEPTEDEKWAVAMEWLGQIDGADEAKRKEIFERLETGGVRIGGTLRDLQEAGLKDEDMDKVFRHMENMVKVWKMGKDKAEREFPVMFEKYAKWARLLRLKWYN